MTAAVLDTPIFAIKNHKSIARPDSALVTHLFYTVEQGGVCYREFFNPSSVSAEPLIKAFNLVAKARTSKFVRNVATMTAAAALAKGVADTLVPSASNLLFDMVAMIISGGIAHKAQRATKAIGKKLKVAAFDFEKKSKRWFEHKGVVANFWRPTPYWSNKPIPHWVTAPVRFVGHLFDSAFNTPVRSIYDWKFYNYMSGARRPLRTARPLQPWITSAATPDITTVVESSLPVAVALPPEQVSALPELLLDDGYRAIEESAPVLAAPAKPIDLSPSASQISAWQIIPPRNQKLAVAGGLLAMVAVGAFAVALRPAQPRPTRPRDSQPLKF